MTEVDFIIDESGSMAAARERVIKVINSQFEEMKQEDEPYLVSLYKFSTSAAPMFSRLTTAEIRPLTKDNYNPNGGTALYDAVGQSLAKDALIKDKKMVYIFTDGQENASKEFTNKGILELISKRQREGWAIIFLGATIDAQETARSFTINNSIQFDFSTLPQAGSLLKATRGTYTTSSATGLAKSLVLEKHVDLTN